MSWEVSSVNKLSRSSLPANQSESGILNNHKVHILKKVAIGIAILAATIVMIAANNGLGKVIGTSACLALAGGIGYSLSRDRLHKSQPKISWQEYVNQNPDQLLNQYLDQLNTFLDIRQPLETLRVPAAAAELSLLTQNPASIRINDLNNITVGSLFNRLLKNLSPESISQISKETIIKLNQYLVSLVEKGASPEDILNLVPGIVIFKDLEFIKILREMRISIDNEVVNIGKLYVDVAELKYQMNIEKDPMQILRLATAVQKLTVEIQKIEEKIPRK